MQSDFCQVVQRSPEAPTVIAFSSVNTPRGKFKPYRIVSEIADLNIIFVNDKGNRWYQHGIEGVANNSSDAAIRLVQEGRRIGNGRVITFGTSMGAFGATLFAALGDADGSLAFGGESVLGLPGSRSALYMDVTMDVPFPDLRAVLEMKPTPTVLYASETDEIDLASVARLSALQNVTAVSIRGMEHPGIQIFDFDGSLQNRISTFARTGGHPDGFGRQGVILQKLDLINGLWQSFQAKMVVKDKVQWLEIISNVAARWPRNATVQLRLGEAKYANSDGEGAMQAWREAIDICSYQYESLGKLGNLLRRKKRIDEARALLLRSIEINPWYTHGHHSIGEMYAEQGQLEEAERHLRQAVAINRGNKAFRQSLADILLRSAEAKKQEGEKLLASLGVIPASVEKQKLL